MGEEDKSEMEWEMVWRGENEGWMNGWGHSDQQVLGDAGNEGKGMDVGWEMIGIGNNQDHEKTM